MPNFVICVPVYNAGLYIDRALHSAMTQDFRNYRVVVIDDASTDDTWKKIVKYKVDAIRNPERVGPMINHIRLVDQCDDDEIVVTLDGDDELADSNVLTRLAQEYADPNVWMTYGSYEYDKWSRNPNGDWRGISAPVGGNHDRMSGFTCSHLRTYYAWLFRKIPHDYFKMNGEYVSMAADVAIMWALIELAGPIHAHYIHDVLYYYNAVSPLNEFRVDQDKVMEVLNYLQALTPLARRMGRDG